MSSLYRINVNRGKPHEPVSFHAPADHSSAAKELYALMVERFPPDEGFAVTVSQWAGSRVSWAPFTQEEAARVHPSTVLREAGVKPADIETVRQETRKRDPSDARGEIPHDHEIDTALAKANRSLDAGFSELHGHVVFRALPLLNIEVGGPQHARVLERFHLGAWGRL